MKKQRRFIAAFLSVVLAASCMAGCGKKTETSSVDENGKYVPSKDLKITIWNAQGTDFVKNETSDENIPKDWLTKQTRVEIENIYGNDGGQWDTKLSRLIAGDNLPDILYVADGQGPAHFQKLKKAKKLYPLTKEMIKKYAPNVYDRVPEEYWDLMSSDGEILGIPFGFKKYDEKTQPNASEDVRKFMAEQYQTIATNSTDLYVRDDILKMIYPDAMNYKEMCALVDKEKRSIGNDLWDIPINSTDEYVDFFKKVDSLNLKENGKKVFAFGYSGGDLWIPFTYLGAQMYGYNTNNYITAWDAEKKEIVTPLTGDLVKEAALTQNKLVRNEVFDPESLVQTNSKYKEKILNGQYAVASLGAAGGADQVNKQLEELGKSFRYRLFTTKVPQNSSFPIQYYQAPWVGALCFTDSLDEAGVKQLLNWINVQFSDEFEEILWWGTPEDGLYTEENGQRTYKDDRFNKAYIDGDTSALSVKDCKGIGSLIVSPETEFYVLEGFWLSNNRWNPKMMRMDNSVKSSSSSNAFSITESDPNAKLRPQCDVYDAPYAQIDECVEFWAQREAWEAPFKIALGSNSDASFEKQWKAAVKNFNSITDIPKMREEMTKIAKEQAKDLGIE